VLHFILESSKLTNRILDNRQLVGFSLYTGVVSPVRQPATAKAQRRFLKALTRFPFPVEQFVRPLRYYPGWPKVPPQEKGADAKIVQDLIIGAVDETYDVAVLFLGDQDFVEVVKLLHARFPVELETYYPASRRHLYESSKGCFRKAQVITKNFYNSIR
jgi:uncharacterized LabA/DUF88 family protein